MTGRRRAGSILAPGLLALAATAAAQDRAPDPGTFALRSTERGEGRTARVVGGTLAVRRLDGGRLEVERATRPERAEGEAPVTVWTGQGALDGLRLHVELGASGAAPVASATYVFTPDGLELDEALERIGEASGATWSRGEGRGVRSDPRPAPGPTRRVVVVAGREVPVAADVVTWRDPGGFDAYRRGGFFRPDRPLPTSPASGCEGTLRYAPRSIGEGGAPSLEAVAAHVHQVVVHFDVCWTSRECFRVLHDQRGLSCHFLLDVDGTLYQTLDVADRARHAGPANDRSIGVEIAHPGPLDATLARSYREDDQGTLLDLGLRAGHVRTPGFVPRPARPAPITGTIHGVSYTQWDFTAAQYESLAALLAALHGVLADLPLEAPRDAAGAVRTGQLSDAELASYAGVLGHWHVTTRKNDPGPAFDWDKVLSRARELAVH